MQTKSKEENHFSFVLLLKEEKKSIKEIWHQALNQFLGEKIKHLIMVLFISYNCIFNPKWRLYITSSSTVQQIGEQRPKRKEENNILLKGRINDYRSWASLITIVKAK